MATLRTYDPKAVTVVVGGKLIDGFGADTFVTVTRDDDDWQKMIGVDGTGARAKTNNTAGSISITLLHTSPANSLLMALVTADQQSATGAVPVLIRDTNGSTLCFAASAWVKKMPDVSFQKNVNERTWTLDSCNVEISVGSSN